MEETKNTLSENKPQELEEIIYLQANGGHTETLSRTLMDAIPGSWFQRQFGMGRPIVMRPMEITEKKKRPLYLVNVPNDVLVAFVHLLTLPELLPSYSTHLPDSCKYGVKLETWLLYLARYFPGDNLLKREREEEEVKEDPNAVYAKDTSRPPKRFRRDYLEWEVCMELVDWIFKNHKNIESFLDQGNEYLCVVMPDTQTLKVKDQVISIKDFIGDDAKKTQRLIKAITRIAQFHHDVSITVETLKLETASRLFGGYSGHHIDRDATWPITREESRKMTLETRVIFISFKWQDWDGNSW